LIINKYFLFLYNLILKLFMTLILNLVTMYISTYLYWPSGMWLYCNFDKYYISTHYTSILIFPFGFNRQTEKEKLFKRLSTQTLILFAFLYSLIITIHVYIVQYSMCPCIHLHDIWCGRALHRTPCFYSANWVYISLHCVYFS